VLKPLDEFPSLVFWPSLKRFPPLGLKAVPLRCSVLLMTRIVEPAMDWTAAVTL
jgi:hypothetical protein